MRILYLDCFSGISGDMTLGALLDLGINKEAFLTELEKLNLPGYKIEIKKKLQNGISGTDVDVILCEQEQHDDDHHHHNNINPHDHDNDHEHDHPHNHEHPHPHPHEHSHEHGMRNLKNIEMIINWSELDEGIKELSKKIFREIAAAEARVHGKSIDEVHFHEVGAVDSIVDIVGTAICLNLLDVDAVYSSPLHDGNGFIECRHGIIPVPVPAVMEMLAGSGIPLIQEDVGTELVTPTGMAIIKTIACGFGKMPSLTIEKAGFGLGKRNTGRLNALRAVIGTDSVQNNSTDEIAVLETNIDNTTPEILGYVAGLLIENGALDAFFTPIYMKKGRPAYMLTVLAVRGAEDGLAELILRETATLGIRKSYQTRYVMDRELLTINTSLGEARVKIASYGSIKKAAPEYEDCRRIAGETGLALTKVYEIVMKEAELRF